MKMIKPKSKGFLMMKSVVAVLVLLFSFSFVYAEDKIQTEQEKSEQQKSEKELAAEKLEERVYESIEILKSDNEPSHKKKAADFLFEHIELSRPLLMEELVNAENDEFFLSNVLNLLLDTETELKISLLLDILHKNLNKPVFVENLLVYLFPIEKQEVLKTIHLLINSKDIHQYKTALKLIASFRLNDYKETLLSQLKKVTIVYHLQNILLCVAELELKPADLDAFSPLLSHQDEEIRELAIMIFSRYPEKESELITLYSKSEDFHRQISLMNIIALYNTVSSYEFLVSELKNTYHFNKVMAFFLTNRGLKPDVFQVILKHYGETGDFEYKLKLLKLSSIIFDSRKFQDQAVMMAEFAASGLISEKKKEVISGLCELIYKTGLADEKIINLLKNLPQKKKNWESEKFIRLILDSNLKK